MKEKMKKTFSKVRTGCYLLPCFLMAGGAVFAGSDRVSATTTVELDGYNISKVEEVLKAQAQAQESTGSSGKTKVSSVKGKTAQKDKKGSKHGEAQSFLDGTYEGVGVGFAGHIKVKVVVEDSKILSIEVTEVEADDAPFVAKAKGVIESILQYQTIDVDTVSGATYTSNGIISAIQNALSQAKKDSGEKVDKGFTEKNQGKNETGTQTEETTGYQDGVYTGTAKGFRGDMQATVTIKNKKINNITIESKDDESFLKKAMTLVDAIIKKQTAEGIDVVTGATYSSNGIINSVKDALKKAGSSEEINKEEVEVLPSPTPRPEPTPTDSPEPTPGGEDGTKKYRDGSYQAKAVGFNGNVVVEVLIQNGNISKINIKEYQDDDEFFWDAYNGVTSQIFKKQTAEGIDVVSGATYSSEGIINAVKKALEQAKE